MPSSAGLAAVLRVAMSTIPALDAVSKCQLSRIFVTNVAIHAISAEGHPTIGGVAYGPGRTRTARQFRPPVSSEFSVIIRPGLC
ncbi:hypothetical protein AWH69_02440 [Janibacter melonis]|uniref:Uncharacterized protein n=1 Tax=Janibacter melonis TaxID=262209 RepID=A0A176QG71_9MICO|nr:hypothetical protein AWH69_02440 [Janibacter melonis]